MLLTTGVGVGLGVRQTPAAVAADEQPKPADKPKAGGGRRPQASRNSEGG